MRGLDDSFDIEKAMPASAKYLGELKAGFGNLGLAAAAYNAGESRVSRWLASGGFLPLETEDYVLDIMGEPADNFTERHMPARSSHWIRSSISRGVPQAAGDDERGVAMATVQIKPGACRWPAISAAPPRSGSGSA